MPTQRFPFTLFRGRPNLDQACCTLFLQDRLKLPKISLPDLFEKFDYVTVRLETLPRGPWSTPLRDVVALLKTVLCTEPDRVMEVGSYQGYTALLLAQHVPDDTMIVTVDREPDHGEAYRETEFASKIDRRVGTISPKLFQEDLKSSYDFIFLDAGHKYHEVKHDTELLLPLLSENGFFFWHDYANWGYFMQHNGVPEYLNELRQTYPVAHVEGTDLGVYSPAWEEKKHDEYRSAIVGDSKDPWSSSALRG